MTGIGGELRGRRQELGATIEQAARWAGLTAGRVAELESGAGATVGELDDLCRGLGVTAAALLAGEASAPRRSIARFRSVAPADGLAAEDLRALSVAAEIGRVLGGLVAMLGREVTLQGFREPVGVDDARAPWEQGYELGAQDRQRLGVPAGPIQDVTALFRDLGIHIVEISFSLAEIEGASLWERGSVPIVLINERAGRATYPPSRRAILSHELCHLLHDGGEADVATRISLEKSLDDAVEQRARAFAPAFLAPPAALRAWGEEHFQSYATPREITEMLAQTWGLSFEGAAWHAKNCGLIPDGEARKLVETGPRGVEVVDTALEASRGKGPVPQLPSTPSRFLSGLGAELVSAAWLAGEISEGRAREILTWT